MPENNAPKSFVLPLIIVCFIFVVAAAVGGYYLGTSQSNNPTEPTIVPSMVPSGSISPLPLMPEQAGCTMEAKICKDGTAVGRTGPNCEFAPCPEENLGPPIEPTQSKQTGSGSCKVGGCSGELCSDATMNDQLLSTCQYKDEYACFKHSKCERQANGQCGWTQTPQYTQCISAVQSSQSAPGGMEAR